jgi:iron complex outermembrane receptor protein
VLKLNDSVIVNNRPTLAALLNYNSPVYFKENGPGMVASPSFRGTTAQQTAVIWNGININSQFNGQTDFNTITAKDFNAISVRSGGGSVIYGSSAIGGSIHLNNDLRFEKRFENAMAVDYGSFNTLGANYRLDAGSDAIAMQIGLSHNSSDNDFDFAHGGKNENGRYRNSSVDIGLGVKVDANNSVRILTYAYSGERHFSLISPTDTKTKYRDRNERSLLEWVNIAGKLSSKFKAVYLNEHYDFFGNIANAASNFGNAQTLIARYDGLYSFNPKMAVNAIADFTETRATGSDLGRKTRQIVSFAVLFKHRPIEKFGYEIGVRNEITDNYESPVLFSAGADYRFSPFYTLKVNASKNFRIPTLNDLYWLDGGNPDLKPETALQGEIGNVLTYKNWQLTITGYYASIQDMIQWLPGTTTFWNPLNINEARTYGIENMLGWSRKFGRHQLAVTGTYAYTVS